MHSYLLSDWVKGDIVITQKIFVGCVFKIVQLKMLQVHSQFRQFQGYES